MAKSRRPFGSVFRRKNRGGKKGSTWYVRIRIGGRDVLRCVGPDRSVAVAKLAEMRSKLERERVLDVKELARATYDEFWKQISPVIQSRLAGKGHDVEGSRAKIIGAYFGKQAICDIDVARVEDFRAYLMNERKVAVGTCNRYLSSLSVVMKEAVNRGFAARNPVRDVKRVREEQLAVPYIAVEQLDKIVAACPSFLQPIVILAFETGLRRSEIVRLCWRDIDFGQHTVLVRHAKSKRCRTVPLTPRAESVLRAIASALAPDAKHDQEAVFPEIAAKGLEQGGSFISHQFDKVTHAMGIGDVTLHSLRHAFCSGLARAGVPLPTIAELAGHSQISVTFRYARHAPQGAARQAIDLLAKSREPAAPAVQPSTVAETAPAWGWQTRTSSALEPLARRDFMVECVAA